MTGRFQGDSEPDDFIPKLVDLMMDGRKDGLEVLSELRRTPPALQVERDGKVVGSAQWGLPVPVDPAIRADLDPATRLATVSMTLELAAMFPGKSGGVARYAIEGWKRYFAPLGAIASFGYWIGWSLAIAVT